MSNFDAKFQVVPLSMKERLRIHYLIDKTFGIRKYQSKKKHKLFRYRKIKLKEKPELLLRWGNGVYVNVRKLLEQLGVGAMAFWKWKSDGRLDEFEMIKYKGLWYINKNQVNLFISCIMKKQVNFYWNEKGGKR